MVNKAQHKTFDVEQPLWCWKCKHCPAPLVASVVLVV